MPKRSKRYQALEKAAPKSAVPLRDAVEQLKKFGNNTKFDQTVEIHMRLGIDHTQADQLVRGSVVLPHGIGRSQRVIVFAKGDLAERWYDGDRVAIDQRRNRRPTPIMSGPTISSRTRHWTEAFCGY